MTTKEKVKALWQLCFDDNEEFVEMYFRLRYKNEINIAIESGDEIVSALQMIPYPMTFCGDTVQTSYISGACTHPDFRGNGVMRELLSQAFAKMLRNGTYFSTLIPAEPWLFDYYTRMGYASVFQYSVKEITVPEFIPSKEITVTSEIGCQKEVYEYLNSKLSGRTCCIQHSFEDFQVVMAPGPGPRCKAHPGRHDWCGSSGMRAPPRRMALLHGNGPVPAGARADAQTAGNLPARLFRQRV